MIKKKGREKKMLWGKQQIKCICLCNSTQPLSVIMLPLYFVGIQCKVLGVYFLFRNFQITLWKHPSVSLSSPRSPQCRLLAVVISCMKRDGMKEVFCIQESWKDNHVAFVENDCYLLPDKIIHFKARFRKINLFALFIQFWEVKLLWMQWLNLANNEQRWHWL